MNINFTDQFADFNDNFSNPKPHEGNYCYRYPHPAVTTDCVIFGLMDDALQVLLIERGVEPFKGQWALPGGFMKINETLEEAAARELREETNLDGIYMQQFKAYSTVDRDPRERVVTVAFIAIVKPAYHNLVAGDDAANASWFNFDNLPPLAFDHRVILEEARQYLRRQIRVEPLAFRLLNEIFSLGELQKVYEIITGTLFDRRNFQRSVMGAEILIVNNGPLEKGERIQTFTRSKEGTTLYSAKLDNLKKRPKKGSIKGLFDLFNI